MELAAVNCSRVGCLAGHGTPQGRIEAAVAGRGRRKASIRAGRESLQAQLRPQALQV